jgi:hypothetical protein
MQLGHVRPRVAKFSLLTNLTDAGARSFSDRGVYSFRSSLSKKPGDYVPKMETGIHAKNLHRERQLI